MNRTLSNTFVALSMVATALGAAGCKRADNNGNEPLNQASSGVMSNSAGPSGTPGSSDAANRAASDAGPAASADNAASAAAPVMATPASAASQ